MALFDNFGKKLTDIGEKAIQKTKDTADSAKLTVAIAEEEKKIRNTYQEIGKLYMQRHRNDCEEEFAVLIATVITSENKIADCRKELLELKGVVICPKCGAEQQAQSAFCSACGSPLPGEQA